MPYIEGDLRAPQGARFAVVGPMEHTPLPVTA